MNLADSWLEAYNEGHTVLANKALHWLCAPVLAASVVGVLWSLPVPEAFSGASKVFNWGTLSVMTVVVYYFILSIRLALGILPFVFGVVLGIAELDTLDTPLWLVSSAGIGIAGLGQLIGHLIEGGNASLMRDIHYVAIAPLWMLASVYRRLGIPI
jgi:uncharacterized membrane protein YGL010W